MTMRAFMLSCAPVWRAHFPGQHPELEKLLYEDSGISHPGQDVGLPAFRHQVNAQDVCG